MLLNGVIIFTIIVCGEAMTLKQIKQTGKTLRKSCLAKTGVEEAKIDGISAGKFIDEREVRCYIACIFKMSNMLLKDKVSYEQSVKQVDLMLPEDLKEPVKASLTKCKKVPGEHKDLCDSSFFFAKCLQAANPEIYFCP